MAPQVRYVLFLPLASDLSKSGLTYDTHNTGQFFSRRVELGGRLFSSESSSNISGASASAKANRMKIAASASFSSPFAQASVSASHETESTKEEAQSQSALNKSISWRAQGGNTLLANKYVFVCEHLQVDVLTDLVQPSRLVLNSGTLPELADIPGRHSVLDSRKRRLIYCCTAIRCHGDAGFYSHPVRKTERNCR
jgi:hypothetical protein